MPQLYPKIRSCFALLCCCLLPCLGFATHIVGGEIELIALGPTSALSHRINLNMYFDVNNGYPGAEDVAVRLGVFRKRDNGFLGYVELSRVARIDVPYTVVTCANANQRTRLIRYSADLNLTADVFSDAGGYYISWERCCRNGTISNIQLPGDAGSTFYLEFPAIVANGRSFINSSPVFNPLRGDYACVNQPFSLDFGATDADGDSLVYSMVTPLNGYSSSLPASNRNPSAGDVYYRGPYPSIAWLTGFSATNAIPGTSPLTVNARTGRLSVTARQQGLYVFSVEVVEYRNRVAIGRVRRDFQLRVIDCARNTAPVLLMRTPGSNSFYRPGTVLSYKDTDKICLDLLLTDLDSNQRITVTNGSGTLSGLTIAPGVVNSGKGRDTTRAQFCFDACTAFRNGAPVTIRIQATDDACPQGITTNLDILVQVAATPGIGPAASTDLRNSQGTVTVGSSLSFNAFGKDPQNGLVSIQAVGRGFALASAGMTFAPGSATATVQQPFTWKPTCAQVTSATYVVDFIATKRTCNVDRRDTTTVRLTARGLPSEPPTIRTSLPNPAIELTLMPNDTTSGRVRFTVFGNDPDKGDTLRLTGAGRGFTFAQLGMQFSNRTGRPELQSPFSWLATCQSLQGKREATFTLDFANTDGSCQARNRDTTSVTVKLKTPIVNPDDLRIPNIFTPNGDGKNDYFALIGVPQESCYERFERVEVYNRWGSLVFSSTDKAFRWAPTDYPPGTYYYTVAYAGRQVKGTVMLVR
jgi:gliding motility-associated-like protein